MKKQEFSTTYATHDKLLENTTIAFKPLKDLCEEIAITYLADNRPWIIGFSGGKDSTAVLSLVYSALQYIPAV